jgi:TIGR03009 family protein
MRKYGLTLSVVLLANWTLCAQQTSTGTNGTLTGAVKVGLDDILARWERSMKAVNGLTATLTRTTLQKTFQATEVFEGTAKYMKPNLALLYMGRKNKPEIFEKYVCSGNFLYEFVPREKLIRVHELPQPKQGQVADDNLLSFLFGMKAAEAKRRYDMTMLAPPPNDKWYYYVLIKPKTQRDKNDFSRARLVLSNTTFLPRQLWFEQPNGNEITWDFVKLDVKTPLQRTEFGPPPVPKDWKVVKIPLDKAAPARTPRIARPNQ